MLNFASLRLWAFALAWVGGSFALLFAVAAGPVAKWVGQDGRDFVGGEPGPAPNGYQDVHIVLSGLPAGRNLTEVVLGGYGSDLWNNVVTNKAAVRVDRGAKPGSFDLYLEPFRREVGREFQLKWKLDDGRSGETYFPGGKADPNLRAPGLGVEAKWMTPAGHDRTGLGVGVGPDGLEDAQLAIGKLRPKAEIKEVSVGLAGASGAKWRSGLNPQGASSAEFVRRGDDPTRGDLFFSPSPDLTEKKSLALTITYGDDRTDSTSVVVGKLPTPKPIGPAKPDNLAGSTARGKWLGQGPLGSTPRGEVRVEVDGLVPGRSIVGAALSDGVVSTWRFRRDEAVKLDAGPGPLGMRLVRPSPGKLELGFMPTRDESGSTMTLRLVDASGHEDVVRFPGGPVDFGQVAPSLPPGSTEAKPGDDLQQLAERFGTIRLAPGTYRLTRPLVLSRPIKIVGPGAALRFSQADAKPWTAAMVIHSGGTTLEGFAVRFDGPIRWDREVDHGPAVIATAGRRDGGKGGEIRHQVALMGLDLQSPTASTDWEEAIQLVNFLGASSGRIERCRLKGGAVLFGRGPWSVVDNEFLGTLPRTYSQGVFAALYPHDLVLARNRAHDVGPSGKTWRFLVLAQSGANDRVADNVVDGGIGPRQDDPHPHQNAPELILTEAYRLHYEGKPAGISPDGRVLAIFEPQGGPASTGDALAILAGSQAGQWRTIAQPIGPRLYLLDEPIAQDATAVSIATGFVRETFEDNTVDCRGSALAANLVLAGNMFGVRVLGNKFYGGGETVRLHASPTEAPVHWGWSHAPFLGGTFADNLVLDSLGVGASGLGVEHGPAIKTNKGRVYMTLDLSNNTFRWTEAGKSRRATIAPSQASTSPRFAIGYAPSLDPDELVVTERGTRLEGAPADALWVNGARINGEVVRNAPLKSRP